VRASGAGAARWDRPEAAPGVGEALPGRRVGSLLRPVAQGGRLRSEPHRRVARDPLRSLVEPGGREPGQRPGVPYRADEERSGSQVRVPGDRRGEDRRADRIEAAALDGAAGRRRRAESDGVAGRGAAQARGTRSQRRDEGVTPMWYEWRAYVPATQRRRQGE